MPNDLPSDKYRLMIYFAHSTMVMYSASIQSKESMSVDNFYMLNKEVMERVNQEAKNIFNYELSYGQIAKACYAYLQAKYYPQSVNKTKAFQL